MIFFKILLSLITVYSILCFPMGLFSESGLSWLWEISTIIRIILTIALVITSIIFSVLKIEIIVFAIVFGIFFLITLL